MSNFAKRRERLVQTLPPGVDLLAVSNPISVTYLTGFTGDSSWVFVAKDRTILVSDGRYEVQIAEECAGLDTVIRPPNQTIIEAVAQTATKLGIANIGVEASHLTLAEHERLRDLAKTVSWTPTTGLVEKLRRVKDESEIAQIREAVDIAQKAYAMFRSMLQRGDSEKTLVDAMEGYLRRAGGSGSSFPPIVAVGDRSALPHCPPTSRRVEESPLLLLDWGATGRLYKSDITRILLTENLLGTNVKPRRAVESLLEKRYTVVLRGQQIAIDAMRPGAKASDIDKAVRAYFETKGVNANFNHGLGHGLGLQIHEGPFMRSNSNDELEAGNVVTVEPGIYFPGWGGIRIEDDVLITPDGCEVLTSVPKDTASVFS